MPLTGRQESVMPLTETEETREAHACAPHRIMPRLPSTYDSTLRRPTRDLMLLHVPYSSARILNARLISPPAGRIKVTSDVPFLSRAGQ